MIDYYHIWDDDLVTKCLEECAGQEAELCLYQESSRLVENIFGNCSSGALSFISRLMLIKRVRLVELINSGCSARTVWFFKIYDIELHVFQLETLLYAIDRTDMSSKTLHLLVELTSIITDEWMTISSNQHGAHVLRSLARILVGLSKNDVIDQSTQRSKSLVFMKKNSPNRPALTELLSRGLDWNLMKG